VRTQDSGLRTQTGDLCLGLISGTSVDGIDAALVRIVGHGRGARVSLLAFATFPYPDALRAELLDLYDDGRNAVARLCSLNFAVGERFADAARALCSQARVDPNELSVIGSHGQTVWHQPAADPDSPLSTPSTLQIGEPTVIAARTGVTTVGDFRVADMAAGGQGAPLAPYFDWVVLTHETHGRCVQNIGGIGNVTWLPPSGDVADVRAFDTGPGNILLDGLVSLLTDGQQTFDRDGALAAEGTVDESLLTELLADPYLATPPPKTTGRERYGLAMCRDLLAGAALRVGDLIDGDVGAQRRARDLLATVTAFTAHSIADAYRRWLPDGAVVDEVLVNGGGARNPTLLAMLADLLVPTPVRPTDAIGLDGDAKEAMTFALLAHDTIAGWPTNIPAATGAARAVPLGKVALVLDQGSD
jgi:anhydro-N-acetylmuramic acid kinase